MAPNTHLRVHTGGTNRRLTVQLPLIVPDGIKFRVANETRGYQPNTALVFDDCYEHEVQHLGSTDRYVLYMTSRHPDLGLDLHRPAAYDQALLEIAAEALEQGSLSEEGLEEMKLNLAKLSRHGVQGHDEL